MRRALLAAALAAATLAACGGGNDGTDGTDSADAGDAAAERGRAAYLAACAACHGQDLKGTKTGPPFLHAVYEPNHHSDDSFRLAVRRGVQPHHWQFGPMPPQPQVSDEDVEAIIAYVRQQQRAAGI